MFKRFIYLFIVSVFLMGCETVGPTKSDLASLSDGNMGVVLLDYEEFEDLYSYNVYLANQDTGQITLLNGSNNPGAWVKGNIAMNTVTPGEYRIVKGNLANYDTSANMPLIGLWFEPFEVQKGELVDLGKLVMRTVEVSSIKAHSQGLIGRMLGMKEYKGDSTFIIYEFENMNSERATQLFEKTPELSVLNLVSRKPQARFTREEFEDAVLEAYAYNADGTLPKESEAEQKLIKTLSAIVIRQNN